MFVFQVYINCNMFRMPWLLLHTPVDMSMLLPRHSLRQHFLCETLSPNFSCLRSAHNPSCAVSASPRTPSATLSSSLSTPAPVEMAALVMRLSPPNLETFAD